jgi:hypothetical protein
MFATTFDLAKGLTYRLSEPEPYNRSANNMLKTLGEIPLHYLLGGSMLSVIVIMTYVHMIMNWLRGVKRKGWRSYILYSMYHIKFALFASLLWAYPDTIILSFASMVTVVFIVFSSLLLGNMGLRYHWEFGGPDKNRRIVPTRGPSYHFTHDMLALAGMLAALLLAYGLETH